MGFSYRESRGDLQTDFLTANRVCTASYSGEASLTMKRDPVAPQASYPIVTFPPMLELSSSFIYSSFIALGVIELGGGTQRH